jgi:hypothetical protein
MAGVAEQALGLIQLDAGDTVAATEALQRSDRILEHVGAVSVRSTTQAALALALANLDQPVEALEAAELAEELSSPQDLMNFVLTNGARALLAVARHDSDQVETLRVC